MRCPKCNQEQSSTTVCDYCGIIFEKYQLRQHLNTAVRQEEKIRPTGIRVIIWSFIIIFTVAILVTIGYHTSYTRKKDLLHRQSTLSSVNFEDEPLQSETNAPSFLFKNVTIKPLSSFLIRARILSKKTYTSDKESTISPLDLALGWKRMADPSIYERLNISQNGRWYRYSWSDEPPIPLQEIIESSANMHMIPIDGSVEQVFELAKPGDIIKIKGFLIEAESSDGAKWRSSLSRSDSGNGSCEVIFVEAAEVE